MTATRIASPTSPALLGILILITKDLTGFQMMSFYRTPLQTKSIQPKKIHGNLLGLT
jgi:hypothetical protein